MKQKKINILKILVSIIIAFGTSTVIYIKNSNLSIIFYLEMIALFYFFSVILIFPRDRFNPFSFFLLSLLLGVLDIIVVVCGGRKLNSALYDIGIYEKSLFIIIVWLVSFCVGYFLKSKKEKKSNKSFLNNVDNTILVILGLIVNVFIALIVVQTIITVGGITNAMNSFAVFRYNNQGYLVRLLPLLAIVVIAFYDRGNRRLALIFLVLDFILIALTGRRGLTINTLIIPILVYYNYKVKKISNKDIIIITIPLIVFILFIGGIRNQKISVKNSTDNIFFNAVASLTNTIQYGQNIPDLINALETKKVSFQGGKYILNGVLGLLPRRIFPNKVESDHSLITSYLVYYEGIEYGKPVGAFGFSYLCFGYVGIIISGLISGIATKILYVWMRRNNKNSVAILIYALLVQSVMAITNPEAQVKIIVVGILILALVFFSKRKGKKKIDENSIIKKNQVY